jgi:hypothetical protein
MLEAEIGVHLCERQGMCYLGREHILIRKLRAC